MNTVFITGITGFLGSKIAEIFLNNGIRVISSTRIGSSQHRIEHLKDDPNLIITSQDTPIDELFRQNSVEAVLHTSTCYGRDNEPWSEIAETNLIAPLRLLFTSEHTGVSCFINADTFFTENISFEGNEAYYVKTKKDFLEIAKNWTRTHHLKFFNMRIEQMYGPADNVKKFMPSILNKLKLSDEIALTPGEQRRDLIYVDDVARAFYLAYMHKANLDKFEEFGLGSGTSKSIREIVTDLHAEMNSSAVLKFGQIPYRKNEIMESHADTSRNNKIGWTPEIDWAHGSKRTIDYYGRQ